MMRDPCDVCGDEACASFCLPCVQKDRARVETETVARIVAFIRASKITGPDDGVVGLLERQRDALAEVVERRGHLNLDAHRKVIGRP